MVRFESAEEQAARAALAEATDLAPVTYLPGAAPGMKRRSPLEGRSRAGSADGGRDEGDGERGEATAGAPVLSLGHRLRGAEARDHGDAAGFGGAASLDDAADLDDAQDADEVDAQVERQRGEKLLLQRLRGRSLSTAEAKDALRSTELAEEDIDDIVERFTELHYIDEARLADQIIYSHHERKGLGRTAVEAEMRRRKIVPAVMLEKLDDIPDDEQERATELAVKRVQQLERYDDQTIDRRLTGFLMRKGYSSAAVRVAVKAALASRGGKKSSTVRFR